MTVDNIIAEVSQELGRDKDSLGALVHGSHARNDPHPESDIDILCLTNTGWFSKEIRMMDGHEVEIQRVPEVKIRADLKRRNALNNNYALSVLVGGRILFDKDGALAGLQKEAKRRHDEGPQEATEFEILMGRSFYRHRLGDARRTIESGDPLGLATFKMDLLFHRAIYGYCKTHRVWADKIELFLEDLKDRDSSTYGMCQSFLREKSPTERLRRLEALIEVVVKPYGWGSLTYETPRVPVVVNGQVVGGLLG